MTELYGMSQFQDSETAEVAAMHNKFGFDIAKGPHLTTLWKERHAKIMEEVEEFREACEAGDLAEAADALIDAVVFIKGTAVMMGLPWGELWQDVMRANMAKERGENPKRPGHKQDLYKPEGWVPPNPQAIIDRHRQS